MVHDWCWFLTIKSIREKVDASGKRDRWHDSKLSIGRINQHVQLVSKVPIFTMQNYLELIKTSTETSPNLMRGVLEGLTDGVLILSEQGEWIYHNYYAHCICQELNQGQPALNQVPDAIWRNCLALIDSRDLYPTHPVVIESEIVLSQSQVYRIRVRWLVLEDSQRPYLMVLLEDRSQSLQNQALAESMLYELTPRQAEVWLLYRAGFSYQDIAIELYITLNTVKRHLKDIRLKQKAVSDSGYKLDCANA